MKAPTRGRTTRGWRGVPSVSTAKIGHVCVVACFAPGAVAPVVGILPDFLGRPGGMNTAIYSESGCA